MRLSFAVSVLLLLGLAPAVQAETIDPQPAPRRLTPLTKVVVSKPGMIGYPTPSSPISISYRINLAFEAAQGADPNALDLSRLPVIQNFVTEEGDLALPSTGLPFDFGVVNSFGGYGLGINRQF
jgi:hypothetical protein